MANTPTTVARLSGMATTPITVAKYTFLDGSSPPQIPTETITGFDGFLVGCAVKFGTTAPNTLTVTITDEDSISIYAGTVTASGRLTAPDSLIPVSGTLTVALTGNSTANATGTIKLFFI